MATCRFCKKHIYRGEPEIKYSTRHYAHPDCYLDAGKTLGELSIYQIRHRFPVSLLSDRGLLEEAKRIVEDGPYG